ADLLDLADRIDHAPGLDGPSARTHSTLALWLRHAHAMVEQADQPDSKWCLVAGPPNMAQRNPLLWLSLIENGRTPTPADEASARQTRVDGRHVAGPLISALDNLGELRARLHSADSALRALRRQVRGKAPPPADEAGAQLDMVIDTIGEALEQLWFTE